MLVTMWGSRKDFESWTRSESFHKAHEKAREWFLVPTRLEVYEAAGD